VKAHNAKMMAWSLVLASLFANGCATGDKKGRVEQAEPQADRSATLPAETPPVQEETPRAATPKDRPTPPAREQAKKAPPAQEQARKPARPAPSPERQKPTGQEQEQARQETTGLQKKEAHQDQPAAEPRADQSGTEAPAEAQGEQQAKIQDRVTPLDQSGSPDDIEITRRIRQRLMSEDLSFSAKNVLVITEEDRVVLKGSVNSPSEAERVKGVAGALTTKQIEDRLEIGGQ
jgi:BON domain